MNRIPVFTRLLVALVALVIVAGSAVASLPTLPRDHWAVVSLDDLAKRGLLHGYPAAPLALPAEVTRAEAAALVVRAVEGLGEAIEQQGAGLRGAASGESSEAGAALQPEDVARIEKLVAEFRNELVTMGVKVDDLDKMMKDLTTRVAKIESTMASHTIAGFIQARVVSGRSSDPSTAVMIQRARLVLSGPIGGRGFYTLELAGDGTVTSPNDRTARVLAAYARVLFGPRTWVQVGQMKTPFGYEIPRTDPILEAPERAQIFRQAFFIYDTGIEVHRDLGGGWAFDLGGFQGAGLALDPSNSLDIGGNLSLTRGNLTAGVSGYTGDVTLGSSSDLDRQFAGLFVQVAPGRWVFRGEVVTGRGPLLASPAGGVHDMNALIAVAGYKVSKTSTIYGKFDSFDPDRDTADNSQDTWALIFMHDIAPNVRLRIAEEWLRGGSLAPHGNLITGEIQIRY